MFVIPVRHPAAQLSRQLECLFDPAHPEAKALRSPALDISETDSSYVLRMDLPGVEKEAVKVHVEGRKLSINAEQSPAPSPEGERSLYRERAQTRFSRQITLPQEMSLSHSSAKLDKGVLTLTLAKRVTEGVGTLNID
ncbi:MAG: Hsp20/alpha crystallin family protein [Roseateles asaccharophilus]|uniref:HSP20 family protein n=1 Tax=Roseateles asaccharophilus TaxID=582607 RepID=A0A4R6N3F9_9BURK|nr:Hsp20/alpha crystallin family protein [Roseateles asaccharophilus]MDN3544531.1 Hsp20/alpha crystallin family protein [Roseateles asaccharophilus]TDP09703.1 HSP20 family protein [Roseateles asaccharophilus]